MDLCIKYKETIEIRNWSRYYLIIRSSHRMCSVKKVFLEILQNSQENTYARVSFLTPTLFQKRLWHRCFLVNFSKFLRTPFLQNTSRRLLLNQQKISKLDQQMHCIQSMPRSSYQRCSVEKGILKYFAKFTGTPVPVSQVFFCGFCGIFTNTLFSQNISGRLLLIVN